MSPTYVVLIGNSDNKLTQREWSRFVSGLDEVARLHGDTMEFSARSEGAEPWQNACVVFTSKVDLSKLVRERLSHLVRDYAQESIALLVGETEFIALPVAEGAK